MAPRRIIAAKLNLDKQVSRDKRLTWKKIVYLTSHK
jgi:hypothetical protein